MFSRLFPSSIQHLRVLCGVCVGIGISLCGEGKGLAADVTIQVADGRSFTAALDPRSNAERIWLRFGTGRTTIMRPIEWPAVVGVRMNGTETTVEDLKRIVAAGDKALPQVAAQQLVVPKSAATKSDSHSGGLRLWRAWDAELSSNAESMPPVRSLAVDVYLANWDADVESDGIVVNFAALDDFGDSAPIDGTLEVELIGERQAPFSRGNAFPVLGRWTQAVTAGDGTSPSGYTRVRLPFQAFHPEYWNSLPWFALANVRLIVPGQGTFEASVDAVRLRGFTPVRDRMEAAAGTRFLPTEQSGRGKRLSGRGPVD